MNALIRKEARLLLPFWAAAIIAATVPFMLISDPGKLGGWGMFVMAYWLGLLPLGVSSFGREFGAATFSQLLVQPVHRKTIWRVKTGVLGVAFALVFLAFYVAFNLRILGSVKLPTWWLAHPVVDGVEVLSYVTIAATMGVAALAFGIWTTLLVRQTTAALFFAMLLPWSVAVSASWLPFATGTGDSVMVSGLVLTVVAILVFVAARRLFSRAQDLAWTGGNIELPAFGTWSLRQAGTTSVPASWRPRRALILKEFQLHQSSLLMAGVLVLLHLGVVLIGNFGGEFAQRPLVALALSSFWLLWFVMPLLVGCSAVAEERKLGTLEAQLCLPVKRSRQHFIKLGVALALGTLLGGVMPLMFEWKMLMRSTTEPSGIAAAFGWFGLTGDLITSMSHFLPALIPSVVAASVCALSFYVSTLTRSTLQGLAPAVAGCIVTWVLLLIGWQTGERFNLGLWRGPIAYFVMVPVMVATLYGLSRANFKHVLVGWRVVARNVLLVGMALAAAAALTSAIFHRAWEVFQDFKMTRGPARLEQRDVHDWAVGQLQAYVHLTDGRVWSALPAKDWVRQSAGRWLGLASRFEAGRFLEDTNWASVSVSTLVSAGVRRDGTLWIAERLGPGPTGEFASLQTMIRHGTGENWACVSVRDGDDLFLLRQDGSLWGMTNRLGATRQRQTLTNFTVQRFGTDSDWTEISSIWWGKALRKRDGRTWHSSFGNNSGAEVVRLTERTKASRVPALDGVKLSHSIWLAQLAAGGVLIGVGEDGALRAVGRWQLNTNQMTGRRDYQLVGSRDQIGTDTNWVALAGNMSDFVALKTDGTLWRWDLTSGEPARLAQAKPERFDGHSDWVGLVSVEDGVAALAADGSIWFWWLEERYQGVQRSRLLAPSRRPELVANLFSP